MTHFTVVDKRHITVVDMTHFTVVDKRQITVVDMTHFTVNKTHLPLLHHLSDSIDPRPD